MYVQGRYPLPNTEDDCLIDREEWNSAGTMFSVCIMDDDKPLLNSELIAKFTRRDPVLAKVMYRVQEGWFESEFSHKSDSQRPVHVPENSCDGLNRT